MLKLRRESRLLKQLNAIEVTKDDLMNVIHDQTEYRHEHPDDDDRSEAGLFLIVRRFSGDPQKAHAVWCRMTAMAKFIDGGSVRGWTMPRSADGCILTQEAVVIAAAQHPFIERGNDVMFEPKSFLNRVLEVAPPEGHG